MRGQLVEVADGENRALSVAPPGRPREAVLSLGYQLETDDVVIRTERQNQPPLLSIRRSGDYKINIDGELSEEKALADSVASILRELGHETEDIAYARPLLNQRVSDDGQIVVYYDRPDQAIVIETQTSRARRPVDGEGTGLPDTLRHQDGSGDRAQPDRGLPDSPGAPGFPARRWLRPGGGHPRPAIWSAT